MSALEGVLVVSLEQAVAAPMASRRLADAGARVIKLERPEGDFCRGYDAAAGGECSHFVWLNRGKESVVCDLTQEAGRRLLDALLAKADVFIQNLKPGALDRLGYGPEVLAQRHRRLVHCSISGYGETGPFATRKAYDLLIQAESGLAEVTGDPHAPGRVGISIVDVATGVTAYGAILEALIRRGRTGQGADIRVAMFDTMVEWMSVPLILAGHGVPPRRIGLSHPGLAPYGRFSTADGADILISIQNDREWRTFTDQILRNGELASDPRFATNIARVANRAATDSLVADWLARHDLAAASAALERADIAFACINSLEAVLAHPHTRMVEVATASGPVRVPAPAAVEPGSRFEPGGVPALGAHTEQVRAEFLA